MKEKKLNYNMKTKIVTSYYGFHDGPPFWGQLNRDRWYKYSLACISELGSDIVCYTDEGDKGYNQLQEIKEKFNLDNLTIKVYKLEENPYQERVYNIRINNAETYNNPDLRHFYCRSQQIYWMKYSFLEMEYESDINLYWIDSGLSHNGLFPAYASRYSVEEDYSNFYNKDGHYINEYKLYCFDKAFNPDVLEKINTYSENKIINLYRNTSDDNYSLFNEKLGLDTNYDSIYPIAGFFGGNSKLMLNYITESKQVIEKVLSLGNYLCNEQEIMGYINATNREWFKNWKFDTFYHEDWTNVYSPNQVSFSHFFLKDLN